MVFKNLYKVAGNINNCSATNSNRLETKEVQRALEEVKPEAGATRAAEDYERDPRLYS